ncbi:MAG: sulfatase, partial [Verrucomicrobiales bacterium]|nr:sulfatase [Verrucomicrobiales bacterium]
TIRASEKLSVLLITSEDNGPDLSCYGNPFVRTPNIDRLAAQGVRFDRAFVPTASCSESRAALLTGLYPHQNGQIGLATHHHRMFGKIPNIASHLKQRGYRTGLIGKLHVNPASAFPFDYRPKVSDCNTFSRRDVGRVAQLASRFFAQEGGPFLLMVNYADAHLPFLRQQHGLPKSPLTGSDVRPLPWIGLDTPRLRESQADYYNCLMRLDEGIGQLLKALEAAGQAKQTLVIYLGDHGAQFPRGKLASYESSLHVPLIIRQPGQIDPQVRNELVSTLDLLPTILHAVGGDITSELPGRSLLPLMKNGAAKPDTSWRTYLFTEYHGHYPPLYFPQRTIRNDRYKLIVNLLQDRLNPVAQSYSGQENPRWGSYVTATDVAQAPRKIRQAYDTWMKAPPLELYDLKSDPHEWQNLADREDLRPIKEKLLAEFRRWQKDTADPLQHPALLQRLTAEHDALPTPYQKPKTSHWKYPTYLKPSVSEEKTN